MTEPLASLLGGLLDAGREMLSSVDLSVLKGVAVQKFAVGGGGAASLLVTGYYLRKTTRIVSLVQTASLIMMVLGLLGVVGVVSLDVSAVKDIIGAVTGTLNIASAALSGALAPIHASASAPGQASESTPTPARRHARRRARADTRTDTNAPANGRERARRGSARVRAITTRAPASASGRPRARLNGARAGGAHLNARTRGRRGGARPQFKSADDETARRQSGVRGRARYIYYAIRYSYRTHANAGNRVQV